MLIGSTEEDVGFNKQTTAQAIGELLQLGSDLFPALKQAHLERCWAGLRPGSADGLPVIGKLPDPDNLIVAAGHYRAGIQLSIGTAQLISELIHGKPLSIHTDAFAIERFSQRQEAHGGLV